MFKTKKTNQALNDVSDNDELDETASLEEIETTSEEVIAKQEETISSEISEDFENQRAATRTDQSSKFSFTADLPMVSTKPTFESLMTIKRKVEAAVNHFKDTVSQAKKLNDPTFGNGTVSDILEKHGVFKPVNHAMALSESNRLNIEVQSIQNIDDVIKVINQTLLNECDYSPKSLNVFLLDELAQIEGSCWKDLKKPYTHQQVQDHLEQFLTRFKKDCS